MKQINLVPLEVRQKAQARQAAPFMVIAGLIGLAAAGAAWAGFGYQLHNLKADKEALITQEQERQKLVAQTAEDLKVSADLTARVTQLNSLAKADIDWNKVFTTVTSLIPKDITLSNYSFAATDQSGMKLTITGVAPSNQSHATFAEFLKKKATSKAIVGFTSDGYAYSPQTGAVTFTMTITIPKDSISFPAS